MNGLSVIVLTTVLFFCGCSPDPSASLAPWPRELEALKRRCVDEQNQSLQTICRIQLASRFGEEQMEAAGNSICQQIVDSLWKEECYFRLGEELAVGGDLDAGFRACVLAGRFIRNCLTHATWRNPYDPSLNSELSLNKLLRRFHENQTALISALHAASPSEQQEAQRNFLSRFGYSVYFGSGIVHPAPSYYHDILGASFRTGYAFEWVRLQQDLSDNSLEDLLTDWKNKKTIRGEADPFAFQKGRHYQSISSPFEKDIPYILLYGGGQRFIGETPTEDIYIAGLEALFYHEQIKPTFYIPFIFHERQAIRLTATKLFLLLDGWTSLDFSTKDKYQYQFEPAQHWLLEHIQPLPPNPKK